MTCEERDSNPDLKTEYRKWKSKKYKVCTFISGKENLVDLTKELLQHNKEVIAQNDNPDTTGNKSDNLSVFIDTTFFVNSKDYRKEL